MWIISFIETVGYLGIFLAMFLETYIPLIQSEIVMSFSGSASVSGDLIIWWVILAGIVGSEVGAISLFLLARMLDREKTLDIISRYGQWIGYEKEDFQKADSWLERHQRLAVFFGRFIPGVRSFVAIPAGVQHMKLWEFAFFNLFGVAVWVSALAWLGYYLSDQYHIVSRYSSNITYIFLGLVLGFVVYRVIKIGLKQ